MKIDFTLIVEGTNDQPDEVELGEMDRAYAELERQKTECAAAGHHKRFYDGEGPLVCICDVEDK